MKCKLVATSAAPQSAAGLTGSSASDDVVGWTGADQFTALGDRLDLPPKSLPSITSSKRVILVRHGQSSWNEAGIIQGSSDYSFLTPKGVQQARATGDMLRGVSFDALFHSPLDRAQHTARLIWGDRSARVAVLPSLREVDLYAFQGLVKDQGKARYGEQYQRWQQYPHMFEVSGHAPVRELWYRASLAWQELLGTPDTTRLLLVVAHNAVNQALLCSALGLPPSYFRRFIQSNGATTVLDFVAPPGGGAPQVLLHHMNQAPAQDGGRTPSSSKPRRLKSLLLLLCSGGGSSRVADTSASAASSSSSSSWKLQAMAVRAGEALAHHQVTSIWTSGSAPAAHMAAALAGIHQEVHRGPAPSITALPPLKGGKGLQQLLGTSGEGGVVAVVAEEEELREVAAAVLDLAGQAEDALRFHEGGISTIELPPSHRPAGPHPAPPPAPSSKAPTSAKSKLLHFNTTSHMGRWAPALAGTDVFAG